MTNITNKKTKEMDIKAKLSTMWIFLTLNYIFADIFSIFGKEVSPIELTQEFMLGAAIFQEITIAMVVLSRVLGYRFNRWANIIAGTINIIIILFMFTGKNPLYYIFFLTIEILCSSLIVWYAFKWRNTEGILNKY